VLAVRTRVRRVKFWWNLSLAYIDRYKQRFILTAIFCFLLVLVGYKILPLVFRANVVSLGYVGTYTLDSIPTQILSLATQSLISTGEDGKPKANLASHWIISDDGKTYIVYLKDNLKWHDDSPVSAQDISIAISDVQIHAINNKTLEFKLPNPVSFFPLALDRPVFKSKSFYGTGMFRIVDIDQVADVVKKISLLPKDKKLPKVDIKFYQTEQQAINALKIGEIKSVSLPNAESFVDWPNFNVERQADRSEIVTIFYNNDDPLLASRETRQALSYAINKSEFDGELATGPISPDNWTYNNNVKRYEFNTSKAKELLSKSTPESPKITLTVLPGLESLAQKIKDDWQEVGIEVTLKKEKSIPDDFQVLLAFNKATATLDQYSLWHSTQKTNITRYKDVKVDKLLEDARITQDETQIKDLRADFQKFLVEDAPATFLYFPYRYDITYKNIEPLIAKLPK